ncbi:MAG TPA: TolC family protein [Thermodesulfovibrionales bacterium]|nr:TolC family protein [Thermodesulfovibrionales bacterium]
MRGKLFFLSILCFLSFACAASAEILTLPQGLRLVAENNRLIKIAGRQEAISEADTLIARSPLLPQAYASANQTFLSHQPKAIFGDVIVPTSDKDYYSYSITVQQTLYDFRENASRYEASMAILETKRFDTKRVRNLVSLDFSLTYFDLLEAEKRILVADKEVQQLEAHLRDAENLYGEGVITRNDLLQAEVRLSDARQRLLSAKNLRAITSSRLNAFLVRPLATDSEVADIQEVGLEWTGLDLERSWQTALSRRPEISIANETLRSLNLEEEARKAEYFPKFFAQGGYSYTENRYVVNQGNLQLLLGMTMSLFSGGSTKAGILKVRNQKLQLIEEKAKLEDDIRLEVENYLLDLRDARERISVARDAVGQAEENLRINRVRYAEGAGTATDVLDAVTLLTTAETNHYRSLYDLRRAEAKVIYALGGDLSEVYK